MDQNLISIILSSRNGKRMSITVNLTDKISNVKRQYKQERAIWNYMGQILEDTKTLNDYEIGEGDCIITNL